MGTNHPPNIESSDATETNRPRTDGGRWQATEAEMDTRRELADRVGTTLSRNEQETAIQFFGDADRFEIITYRRTLVRSLLDHEYAKINWLYEHPDESAGGRVGWPLEDREPTSLRRIEGISASVPLGTLSVKGSPRNNDNQSAIISTPAEARAAAEAFAESGGAD